MKTMSEFDSETIGLEKPGPTGKGRHSLNPAKNQDHEVVGSSKWVRTRMCFCQPADLTDCRFHSTKEKGWEECPRSKQAQKDSSLLGRWLWARMVVPKPPQEEKKAA